MAILPQQRLFEPQNALLGFRQGRDDAQQQQNRNALLRAGEAAAGGDFNAAASEAFKGGQLQAGASLRGIGIEDQKREIDQIARLAFAADTPEKMQQAAQAVAQKFGPERAQQFLSTPRDQLIAEAQSVSEQLDRQFRQQQVGQAQSNADRSFGLAREKFDFNKRATALELSLKQADKAAKAGKSNFDPEQKLRKEFQELTKDFRGVRDAFGRIGASAENPSPAGDMSLIFNFMKILDPGSTVREGEAASARDAANVPDRIRALYNKAVNGQGLAAPQRADFVDRSKKLFNARQKQFASTEKQFRTLAERNQLDPGNVVLDFNPAQPPPDTNSTDLADSPSRTTRGGLNFRLVQ